jgi:multidrug efflux pump subunit AcrB
MWIVALALRRPVTIIAMAALMMLFGLYAFFSMSKDIFPAVNIPEVNLVWYYPGMSAPEIEKRIVNITERATSQTVTGVDYIESNSFNGIGLIKIYFKENASTALAIPQLSSVSSAIRNILPQGIAPPTILDFNATNVPINRRRQHQRDADGNAALRLHVQLCRAVPVHVAGSSEPGSVRRSDPAGDAQS